LYNALRAAKLTLGKVSIQICANRERILAGLDHHPTHPREEEDPALVAGNARRGLRLFAVYLAFYAAFVLIVALRPSIMEVLPFAGVNLAVWYGFALIGGALLLALVYFWMCRQAAKESA
jgi:uncharacterized membrane protein (DUF485 family)